MRTVIPEAPFLFSIAALSASLAGLAGLVVGLRRGTDLSKLDVFRLRQIVEFSFANVILAISIVPLAQALGSTENAVRFGGVLSLVYALATGLFLTIRLRRGGITWTRGWTIGVLAINLGLLALSMLAAQSGAIAVYEGLLVVLLIRPMFAFVLVIESFGAPAEHVAPPIESPSGTAAPGTAAGGPVA